MSTIVVTTLLDENDGINVGGISLREAIEAANATEEADTITFDANLAGGTINLTHGELRISESLTITGLGANQLTINAGKQGFRVFNIDDGTLQSGNPDGDNLTDETVIIEGLTITGGQADAGTGANQYGGGVRNTEEILTLRNVVITDNSAQAGGGGVVNSGGRVATDLPPGEQEGILTIIDSTISNNQASRGLGGGLNSFGGEVTIINSTISSNFALDGGGGIVTSFAKTKISNSTIANNTSAGLGAGMSIAGGTFTLTSSIVADNKAVANTDPPSDPTANEIASRDLILEFSTTTSGGNNLIGAGYLSEDNTIFVNGINGDIVGTSENPIDPRLGPLQNNGGSTLTHALLNDSPAIDTGRNPENLTSDQRGAGFNRQTASATDIGAFELQNFIKASFEKLVNGNANTSPSNPLAVNGGDEIIYTYRITNTGTEVLGNTQLPLEVVDDNGTPNNTSDDLRFISGSQSNNGISYTSGDTDSDGFIDPGETWILTADAQVAKKGLVTNTADFKLIGSTFKSDTASYQGAAVINATFDKLVNGNANTSPSNPLAVNVGDGIIYTYRITNTGTEVLGNPQLPLEVVDDNGTPNNTSDDLRFISGSQVNNGISYTSGDTNSDGFIDPGETWILKANPQVAQEGVITNTADLKLIGTTLKSDTASYQGSPAGDLTITKTDGLESVQPGMPLTYTIVVSNTGLATATNATVADTISPLLTNVSWTSVASGGATGNNSGTGNTLSNVVTLTAGSSITYTVKGTVATDALGPTTYTPAKFNLEGNTPTSGTFGNIRTFWAGGVKATARAFNFDKFSGSSWTTAYLGSYSGGLGVTNRNESGRNNTHVTDNSGSVDYIALQFDQVVAVDITGLSFIQGDSDFRYWVGTTNNPITTSNIASVLSNAQLTEVNNGGSSARSANINSGNVVGNFFVIAARPDQTNDGFKVKTLDILKPNTPAPIVLSNTATVTAPAGFTDTNPFNNYAIDTTTIAIF